jgi:hypothetical protein
MLWSMRQPPDPQARTPPSPFGGSLDWPELTAPEPAKPAAPVVSGNKKTPLDTPKKALSQAALHTRPPEKTLIVPDKGFLAPEKGPVAAKPSFSRPAFEQPSVNHRYDGVLTLAEIGRFKAAIKLTNEQQLHWPAVERILRGIGKQQLAQVNSGRKSDVEASALQELYWAARPLLAVMRPDQKEQVRRLVRSLGYGSYASMI